MATRPSVLYGVELYYDIMMYYDRASTDAMFLSQNKKKLDNSCWLTWRKTTLTIFQNPSYSMR